MSDKATKEYWFSPGAAWRSKSSGDTVYVEESIHTNKQFVLISYGKTGRTRYILRDGLLRRYVPAGRACP